MIQAKGLFDAPIRARLAGWGMIFIAPESTGCKQASGTQYSSANIATRRFPAFGALPDEDLWVVGSGTQNNAPMFVRINDTAKSYAGHPELPFRLGIAIPLIDQSNEGLPNEAENEQLNGIEDRLLDNLKGAGRLVLVITTGGMRDFISYVRTPNDAENIVSALRACAKDHEVQHYVESDARWRLFREYS